jgi:hypothetical protein
VDLSPLLRGAWLPGHDDIDIAYLFAWLPRFIYLCSWNEVDVDFFSFSILVKKPPVVALSPYLGKD